MRTVHFVYVLPNEVSLIVKLFRRLFGFEMFRYSSVSSYKWTHPIKAPQSITFHVGKYLEGRFNIKLYDWKERGKVRSSPGDILFGHACPDRNTIMWNSFGDKNLERIYLIQPYNNEFGQMNWAKDAVGKCDKFCAITGDYWVEQLSSSPFQDQINKCYFINMAVDSMDYPFIKHHFNPPGKRKFFYIGRHGRYGDEKGIRLLEQLAIAFPEFKGGYVCDGPGIAGWDKICDPTLLTRETAVRIAKEYDIFINMSRADAQATTILEAMSWGFPVACTNQSGYCKEEKLFYLSLEDMSVNVSVIDSIQKLSNLELEQISMANRSICEHKYSWEQFNSRLDALFKEEQ